MASDAITTKNWRDLIKPRGLQVDQESLTNTYGKFVAEPLERGFGITLGNSLRRVLLSSLQGAAITSVKVEGVEHEFMTIPEVAEDVTDIILNLKEVLLQIHTNEVKTIRIEADGPKEIKAWTIPIGATAPQAAGAIHSDFERGFIRAEVYSVADLDHYKTEAAIKAAGKLRVEGKSYIMRDSDVCHFLFNV